jgi:predicted metal-dependent peptidase
MPRSRRQPPADPATRAFEQAYASLRAHPLFSPLLTRCFVVRRAGDTSVPAGEWAVVTSQGMIHCHPRRRGSADEWTYVIAHCLLHLGLGHLDGRVAHQSSPAWNAACDHAVGLFLDRLKVGVQPAEYRAALGGLPRGEQAAYEHLLATGAGVDVPLDLRFVPTARHDRYWTDRDFPGALAAGLRLAVDRAIATAAGRVDLDGRVLPASDVHRAHQWFVNSFPLLGALAASFELVEDAERCRRMGIAVAAVSAYDRTITFNPQHGLTEAESRFVMAHEILHVALRHHARVEDRDPFLWNVACDYAINLWLVEMGIGDLPSGLLYDPELKGLSAESIYERIVKDLRLQRRLRRAGADHDIVYGPPEWWARGDGVSLDDFYRDALAQGLSYHESSGAGLLPAGLEEEIRAQIQPPIPWEVELSNWFDNYFAPIETRRSYHRPSRRQAATPDIPRPRTVPAETALDGRTFGVLLDTSGSMDRVTLARALGAVAAYAMSRDVPAVRVVYCDAHPYDAGYLQPEAIAGRVKVRGRGGTVLQPGLDLIVGADDFPDDGPVLIITDTEIAEDRRTCPREHAYLVPAGRRLAFPAKGPVFHMPPSQAESGW